MRVFVTGAGGFVGRWLVPRLRAEKWVVSATDMELDVTDRGALRVAFERARPDAIVHLAALSSVARSYGDPAACFRVNFLGTRALLQAAAEAAPEARVLLIGSADEYGGQTPGAPPVREETPLAPRSPYAVTKAAAEQLGLRAAEAGQDVVNVRAFNHTGPGQADLFVAASFARQVAEVEAGVRPPVMRVGNLASVRDLLHVEDVVAAYVRLLDRDVPASIYNVARGRGVAIQTLLDALLERAGLQGRIRVETDPERVRPTDQLVGDSSRLRAATGWQPRHDEEAIFDALLEDWRARTRASAAHSGRA